MYYGPYLPLVACKVNGYVPAMVARGSIASASAHATQEHERDGASQNHLPHACAMQRCNCQRRRRSVRSHLILPDDQWTVLRFQRLTLLHGSLTVTVTRDWLDPSRVTDGELKEQSIPCGAPMQASDTLPVNPPIGVTASAYDAGLPTETVAEDGDVVNEKPLAPQPRTTPA